MEYGDHGKRNERRTSLIIDIINGRNTTEELKYRNTRKMTLNEARKWIESNYKFMDKPLPDPEELYDKMKDFRNEHNKQKISNKAVEYHLRRLLKDGLITKSKGRYYLNLRSAKAIRQVVSLFYAIPVLRRGFHDLTDMWASRVGVSVADAINSRYDITRSFWDYTADFMSVAGNLKDFFNAWYLGNQETKRELLLRYIEFFNPEKHEWNIEHFAWQAIDNLSS